MITTENSRVPDLLIVGGGLGGCLAAVEAVERGLSVVIVEKRVYLGREISAYNHTFARCLQDDDALRRCPEVFQPLFRLYGKTEMVVPEGMVRQTLQEILEERGIPVLFEAEPVAVSCVDETATGLLLACPTGLAWLPGKAIMDGSEQGNLCRLSRGKPYLSAGPVRVHAVFEMQTEGRTAEVLADPPKNELAAAERALGLDVSSLRLHATLRNDTVAVEYAFQAQSSGEPCRARSCLETETRRQSVDLAAWLRQNCSHFKTASLSHLGYECHIQQHDDPGAGADSDCLNLDALPILPWGFSLGDVADMAQSIRRSVARVQPLAAETPLRSGVLRGGALRVPMAALSFAPYADDALTVPLFSAALPEAIETIHRFEADVCVAGVGAAGGMAMTAAAERGCRVAALDVNRDLGGTFTTGRVVDYYCGYQGGVGKAVGRAAKRLMAKAVANPGEGGLSHAYCLLQKTDESPIQLFTGSRVCGVRMVNGRISQILAANEDGLFAVSATVAIDTTGDADLAALAGVPYRIGDERDGMLQSYSMWGSDLYSSDYLQQRYMTDPGVFHPDVYSERLRAISLGHRDNSPHHISPMLTSRESRRIEGRHTLLVEEILNQRIFDDTVAVATTNADSHAFTSSDFARIGALGFGRHLKIRIPYGCFLPKGVDGLLVGAKALAGERDATSFCRMNADIKNAGYALGLAAALAIQENVSVAEVDLKTLQDHLRRIGNLPDWTFEAPAQEPVSIELDRLKQGDLDAFHRLLAYPRTRILPVLEQRYAADAAMENAAEPFVSEKALLCMTLAWHGSESGADYLADLLDRAVAEARHRTLPHLQADRATLLWWHHKQSDYAIVNRLLVMAGRSGSSTVRGAINRLAQETSGLGRPVDRTMPYDYKRQDMVSEPFFNRLMALAGAVERQADPLLAPAMERLLAQPGIAGHAAPLGARNTPRYMLSHLEIRLARAAARCGSQRGLESLVSYLDDQHAFFRRHARRELIVLVGRDLGSIAAWRQWLSQEAKPVSGSQPPPFCPNHHSHQPRQLATN
jgi:hypothetical protein